MATCSRRGLIRIFNQNFVELRNFNSQHTGPVSEMDFDPTGECLATGSADHTVRVFSASGGYVTHNFKGHPGVISAVKFHPNEGNLTLATADLTGAICLWDLRTKKSTWFRNHISCVPDIAFFNQNYFLSVGRDRVLSIWSKDKHREPLKTIPVFESLEAVIPLDSSHFLTGGSSGTIKKWKFDFKKNECIQVETIEESFARSNDGISQFCLFGKKNQETIVTISQVECLFTFRSKYDLQTETRGKVVGFDDEIFDSAFLGDKNIIAVATNSSLLRIYILNGNNPMGFPLDVKLLSGHENSILSIAANEDIFVTGSKDQTARVWKTSDYSCLGKCEGHTDSVCSVAVANNPNKFMLFVSGSDDNSVRLWSSKSLKCLDQKIGHTKSVLDVCFSPNDEIIATASADKTCKLWHVEHIPGKNNSFHLKGPTMELHGHKRAVNSVRFSTVDRVVCTSSADTTIRIWSIATGHSVRTLQGHTSPVSCALFMRNGTSLVSSSSDGTIKTWDLKSSTCGQTIFGEKEGGHEDRIWSLSLFEYETETSSEDQNTKSLQQIIASAGLDGVIAIWRDATEEEKQKRLHVSQEEILNKEALEKSIREKRYLDAAKLALRLDRPHQLRVVLESIPENDMHAFITSLLTENPDSGMVGSFLSALIAWNTLGRTCLVAQRALITCIELGSKLQKLVSPQVWEKFLKSVTPYTNRHFTRIDRLLTKSFVIDRVLESNNKI